MAGLDRETAARMGEDVCHLHYKSVKEEFDSI